MASWREATIWPKARLITLIFPFALVLGVAVGRAFLGTTWGLLPLLALGPAVAATFGGVGYTMAVGVEALLTSMFFLVQGVWLHGPYTRTDLVEPFVVVGVTAAGMLASWARERRERQLAQIRLVAEAAQRVVMRPVPRQVGAVRFEVRYVSAFSQARVGGDLYEIVAVGDRVRLVVGDARGKGLPALQSAAQVLGVFREAAHEEDSLSGIASRIETSLARTPAYEEFVTAIFAEISADGTKLELVSCGHPPPLLLEPASRPRFAECPPGLPLGLGGLADEARIPVTVPLAPFGQVLFYTDGTTEARNRAGDFFPLADSDSVRHPYQPETLLDDLSDELIRYVGHAPDDDVALVLAYNPLEEV